MAEVVDVVAEVEAKTEELLAPEDATEVVDTDRPPNAEPPKTDEVAGGFVVEVLPPNPPKGEAVEDAEVPAKIEDCPLAPPPKTEVAEAVVLGGVS